MWISAISRASQAAGACAISLRALRNGCRARWGSPPGIDEARPQAKPLKRLNSYSLGDGARGMGTEEEMSTSMMTRRAALGVLAGLAISPAGAQPAAFTRFSAIKV